MLRGNYGSATLATFDVYPAPKVRCFDILHPDQRSMVGVTTKCVVSLTRTDLSGVNMRYRILEAMSRCCETQLLY